jgi:hypothetical protein
VTDTANGLLSSQDATSPHLSRLAWLGEQLQANAEQLAELFRNERIIADLSGAEFAELRRATAEARTAGGDVLLLATAAHRRALVEDPAGS